MTTVRRWTGHEARAQRIAPRFSVRAFAERLGIDPRTVSKWEAAGRGFVAEDPATSLNAVESEDLTENLGVEDRRARTCWPVRSLFVGRSGNVGV